MLLDPFGAWVKHLGSAVLPRAPVVAEVLEWRAAQGVIERNRMPSGLPHSCGANAERIAWFIEQKARGRLAASSDTARFDASRGREGWGET